MCLVSPLLMRVARQQKYRKVMKQMKKATVVMMACHSSNCTRLNMRFRVELSAYLEASMRACALLASSEAPSFCK